MIGFEGWRKTLVRGAALLCLAVGPAAGAMTYRDNTVKISISANGYANVRADYTINEFKITSGQDPSQRIKAGQTRSITGNNSQLTFSVGRSASGQVAYWWTQRIPAEQNTFNANPKDLNFAFTGRLVITLTGGILGNNSDTYTLQDIGLAQGNTVSANNWWFGGRSCAVVSGQSNTVKCRGTSTANWPVYFYFQRGGKSVDNIILTRIEYDPYALYSLQPQYRGESTGCVWQPTTLCPPFVTYYNSAQAASLKLTVKNNLLYNSVGELFDTSGATTTPYRSSAIFVMDKNSNIYASNNSEDFMFHHSTILAGASVASAGDLVVEDGIIKTMANCSGHYKPPEWAFEQLVEGLHRQGYTRSLDLLRGC